MRLRWFFIGALSSVTLLLGGVAATNYLVDVSGVYQHNFGFLHAYASKLADGTTGLVKPPLSERKIKIELLKMKAAECYVTGSSHEMTLNLDRAPQLKPYCASLLNLASTSASYEDAVIALHALAGRRGALVIIGLAPWFFKDNADLRWQELGAAYPRARVHFLKNQPAKSRESYAKLANLVNGRYFVRNLEALTKSRPQLSIIEATADRMSPEDAVLHPDGSLQYSQSYIDSTFPRSEHTKCTDFNIYEPFIDESVVSEMETIIREVLASGQRVAFFLAPYHPGIFQCQGSTVAAAAVTERTARSLGAKLGIPVWGSFAPAFHNLTGQDFYDYMHVDADSLYKLRLESDR